MHKYLFLLSFFSFYWVLSVEAQDKIQASDSTYLTQSGVFSLNIADTGLDNWQAGGQNSFSLNTLLNRNYKYEKGSHLWTALLETSYGVQRLGTDGAYKKTDDIIHIQSLYGYKLKNNWYLSYSFDLKTQWEDGEELIDVNDDGKKEEVLISSFMSPGFITTGLFFTYKYNFGEKDFFTANVQPLTGAKITTISNQNIFNTRSEGTKLYGLEKGESIRTEWAFLTLNFSYQKSFNKDNRLVSNLSLFSPLESVGNFDVNWDLLLTSQINSWLGFNISLNLLYDDDTISKIQFKRILGAGVSIKL